MSQPFAEQLEKYRKQADLKRSELAKHLDITVNTLDNYRYKPYQRPPRDKVITLITLFKDQLTPETAQTWANMVNHPLTSAELDEIFPPLAISSAPYPNRERTFTRVPALTEKYFGIDGPKATLTQRLEPQDTPWLLSVDGIGGIGKTALATAIIHQQLQTNNFYDVVWLSAKQEEFVSHAGTRQIEAALKESSFIDDLLGAIDPTLSLNRPPQEKRALLTHWLKNHPYLVVIDNLETIADNEALLEPVRQMANPSKFLFTTRQSLSNHADVFSMTVPKLSSDHAYEMLWHAGDIQNIKALAVADEADLKTIYEVVGGNPLALKLVIGQIRHSTLSRVLNQLQQAKGKRIKDLYTYIYWQSWNALPEEARRVLRIMGLLKEATVEDIVDSDFNPTPLSDMAMEQAIESLLHFSLVERDGGLEDVTYRIHRLTETFLMTNLFGWDNAEEEEEDDSRNDDTA